MAAVYAFYSILLWLLGEFTRSHINLKTVKFTADADPLPPVRYRFPFLHGKRNSLEYVMVSTRESSYMSVNSPSPWHCVTNPLGGIKVRQNSLLFDLHPNPFRPPYRMAIVDRSTRFVSRTAFELNYYEPSYCKTVGIPSTIWVEEVGPKKTTYTVPCGVNEHEAGYFLSLHLPFFPNPPVRLSASRRPTPVDYSLALALASSHSDVILWEVPEYYLYHCVRSPFTPPLPNNLKKILLPLSSRIPLFFLFPRFSGSGFF